MLLWYCNIDYEDQRLTFPEFGKNKAEEMYQWGSLPVLTLTNGTTISQSNAVARYISMTHKGMDGEILYPGN